MEVVNIKAFTADLSQIETLKAIMKALKIKFEVSKEEKSIYNKTFVEKIQKGDIDLKNGKGTKITIEELELLCK